MLRRLVGSIALGALAIGALTSCGDSKAGGTGEFATVYASASPPGSALDSDVAQWVDSKGAKAQPCLSTSFPTIFPDDVTYTITSTPYTTPNTGQTSPIVTSNLQITRITLTLTPANTQTPALPPAFQIQYLSSGQTILPGSNSVTVRVVSDPLKSFFMGGLGSQSITCSNPAFYTYRAVVSFEALEVNTNRVSTITAPGFLQINVADFVDKSA